MSALPPQRRIEEDDDSEDDPDFVPRAGESDSESESEARNVKKAKLSPVETEEELSKKQETRSKLWEDFQASVSTPPPAPRNQTDSKKTIKVLKKYRFAGEDVTKVEQVLEDSEDAKKWPLWGAQAGNGSSGSPLEAGSSPSPGPSSSSTPQPETRPTPSRTGPRRPRKSLDAMFATAKAKKLSTLDKSAMDWKEHVESSHDVKDDLEANRRGGGYLEKVEFLQRVEQRKEAEREQIGSKRRRG